MSWLGEVIGTEKAIIAMCHLQAMPGDPGYDAEKGMDFVLERAYQDLMALQDGGVDSVMFSNEFSLPYLTEVPCATVAAMGRVIGQLMPHIRVPFGVNVLWDGRKSIDLAVATGAKFVREIFSGVYASDFGLWNTNCGETARHRVAVSGQGVRLLFNIVPEAAKYLGNRDIVEIAKSTVFNCKPDALCVSGLTAGAEADSQIIANVKSTLPNTVVLANTGCRPDTIEAQLRIADGAVVGTFFKRGNVFENEVDRSRVEQFMRIVSRFRKD